MACGSFRLGPARTRPAGPPSPEPGAGSAGPAVAKVIKPTGDLLLITGVHAWHALPDRGQHLLSCLYQQMTPRTGTTKATSVSWAITLSGAKTRCTP